MSGDLFGHLEQVLWGQIRSPRSEHDKRIRGSKAGELPCNRPKGPVTGVKEEQLLILCRRTRDLLELTAKQRVKRVSNPKNSATVGGLQCSAAFGLLIRPEILS